MKPIDPLLKKKVYWAEVIFKNLNGLTRSEDASLSFYGMELEKQNATEEGFKKFAWLAAEWFIEEYTSLKKKGKKPTDAEIEKLTKKSLEVGWERYNEKRD